MNIRFEVPPGYGHEVALNDEGKALGAAFWNGGPERCWMVFREPREPKECLRGLLAADVIESGSRVAPRRTDKAWKTTEDEVRKSLTSWINHHHASRGERQP